MNAYSESGAPLIYDWATTHPQSYRFKATIIIYYLIVSVSHGFGSGSAGCFELKVSQRLQVEVLEVHAGL